MKIALLIPICSRNRNYTIQSYPLKDLFIKTFDFPSPHEYKIFLGADHDDPFYLNSSVQQDILSLYKNVSLNFYTDTKHNPVRVWNHLAKMAYDEGYDYFYQLGDDIKILTPGSIPLFIEELKKLNNVGVVGPMDLNNKSLLTQSFVHRSHFETFGFYYPHEFKNWYCDNWIQEVYKPNRSIKLENVQVKNDGHTPRYEVDKKSDYMIYVDKYKKLLKQL
jgi:hypothetical protein